MLSVCVSVYAYLHAYTYIFLCRLCTASVQQYGKEFSIKARVHKTHGTKARKHNKKNRHVEPQTHPYNAPRAVSMPNLMDGQHQRVTHKPIRYYMRHKHVHKIIILYTINVVVFEQYSPFAIQIDARLCASRRQIHADQRQRTNYKQRVLHLEVECFRFSTFHCAEEDLLTHAREYA